MRTTDRMKVYNRQFVARTATTDRVMRTTDREYVHTTVHNEKDNEMVQLTKIILKQTARHNEQSFPLQVKHICQDSSFVTLMSFSAKLSLPARFFPHCFGSHGRLCNRLPTAKRYVTWLVSNHHRSNHDRRIMSENPGVYIAMKSAVIDRSEVSLSYKTINTVVSSLYHQKNVKSLIDSAVLHWTTWLMVFPRNAGFGRFYIVSTRHKILGAFDSTKIPVWNFRNFTRSMKRYIPISQIRPKHTHKLFIS